MPIQYGLTEYGFNKKNFAEIKSQIETSLVDAFGAVNLDDKSNFGQIVGIFTEREALLWEALESIYNAMYPDTASDFSLDSVCALTGLTRLQATTTRVTCQLTGVNNTLITRDSQVGAENISTSFLLESDVSLSNANCIEIVLSISSAELDIYTLIVNNIEITYTPSTNNNIDIHIGVDQDKDGQFDELPETIELDGPSNQLDEEDRDVDIDGDGKTDLEVFVDAAVDGAINIVAEGVKDGINYIFGIDIDGDGVDDATIEIDEQGHAQVLTQDDNISSIRLDKDEHIVLVDDEDGNVDETVSDTIEIEVDVDETYAVLSGLATIINIHFPDLASVRNDELIIKSIDGKSPNQVYLVSDGFVIESVTSNGLFIASEEGSISVPSNALTIIESPISGWLSVNNSEKSNDGRDIESDIELRIRRNESLRLSGSGTIEAIRARLLNLNGVTTVSITENTSDIEVNNLPPHSFEALVEGGEDNEIGSVLWNYKPAGILTYGVTHVTVNDSTGTQQMVSFSRPTPLYIYIDITITKDDTNEYPSNADAIIKEAIVNQFKNLSIGDDVIYQSLYKSVYLVPGIASAEIKVGGNGVESKPSLSQSQNIEVTNSQIAVTDLTKITITN